MENERWPQALRSPDIPGSSSGEQKNDVIPYSAVQNIRGGAAILRKSYSMQQFKDQINEELSDVPPGIREGLYKSNLPGRMPMHLFRLFRLLGRKGPEYDFAVALLKYAPQLFDEDRDFRESVNGIVSAEYTDTTMWWTFAPYLHQSMIAKSMPEKDAIQKILSWARSAPHHQDLETMSRHNLPGLEIFNDEGVYRYVLSEDSNHISHKFTAQEAERIVKEIFGIKDATQA